MIHFPNKTLQRYIPSKEETDLYGAKTMGYEYAEDITADFQNENNREIREAYGVDKDNLYKIYIDKNTQLEDTDELHDENGEI
jgi:hypothetical protein